MKGPGFGEVGETLRRSTVQVRSGRRSAGSGLIWSSDGRIVTNSHVARDSCLTVELWDGREFAARVISRDGPRDLASLEIEAVRLPAARIGDSSRLRVGELVIAVGNPLGFTGALSTGVVHALGPIGGLDGRRWVQAGVRLAPGNSGGPLASAGGQVIGINTMIANGGLALAIPSNTVTDFLENGAGVALGVTVRPVAVAPNSLGLLVLEVSEGSPAHISSLQVGDLLVSIDGKALASPSDLASAIDRTRGGVLALEFLRGDRSRRRQAYVRLVSGVAA